MEKQMSESYQEHMAKGARVTELKAKVAQAKQDLAAVSRLRPAAKSNAKASVMADKIAKNRVEYISVATEAIAELEK